jgi:hypothetical protein
MIPPIRSSHREAQNSFSDTPISRRRLLSQSAAATQPVAAKTP